MYKVLASGAIFAILVWCVLFSPKAASAATIKLNEFLAHPATGNEWVEIYNPDRVDLTSYWIDDDTSFASDTGSSAKKSLSSINTSNLNYPYIVLTSSMFNNTGDMVVLFAADGSLVDSYQYDSDPGPDVVIARSPDGNGDWIVGLAASQGTTNPAAPTPTPVPTATPTPTPTPTNVPTPTPKPTSTPTPSPTSVPTSKPTSTPTPKIVPTANSLVQAASESTVLSAENSLAPSPTPRAEEKVAGWRTPAVAGAFVIAGLFCLGFSGYSFWQKFKGGRIKPL